MPPVFTIDTLSRSPTTTIMQRHTHTHTHTHDRLLEVGGSRVQQQQAQVDSVCRDIDQTSGAITKANVAIKTAGRLA